MAASAKYVELIEDSFKITRDMTPEERKDLLILLLADMLKNNPERAMEYVVKTRESKDA